MKILQVAGIYPLPPLGGIEGVVYTVSIELARLGEEIRVIAPTPALARQVAGGVEFLGLPAHAVSSWIKLPTLAGYRSLADSVRWADIVHVHNPPELFCFLASRLAWKYRKPVVTSVLSPGRLKDHPRALFRILGRIDERLVTTQLRRASIVQDPGEIARLMA